MKTFVLALACLAVISQPATRAQDRAAALPDDASVRAWLADRIANRPDVGIVVGILAADHDRVIAAGSGGPNIEALDGRTVFEIGSATKAFTAAVLADMVARGEVGLDDPVQRFLPADVRMQPRGGTEMRLVDLATHTSGLPRLPANFSPASQEDPYADYTVPLMYQFLSSYQPARNAGERYEYSNLGFGLLGHVLAAKSGQPYAALVTNRVLRPLGMADTGIGVTPVLRRRAAVGHGPRGNPAPNWDFAALAGCGALRSTADDLLKFVAANLAPRPNELGLALRSMQVARRAPGAPGDEMGLAWHIRRAFGDQFIWQNGETGGFHTFIGLNRRTGLGVVVLHNVADSIDDIGFHVLDERFPLAPPAPGRWRVPVGVPAAALDAYAGTYAVPGFSFVVSREADALVVTAGGTKMRAYAEAPDDFFLGVMDAQMTFVKDGQGNVTGVTLHSGGRDTEGRRVR